MRILVTGGYGQVGGELANSPADSQREIVALDLDRLDITDRAVVGKAVGRLRPRLVVNAAAYTAVDDAETDPASWTVNRDGVAHLAEACARAGIPMIHISTDYVFDGAADQAYNEDADPAPRSEYGRSKLAGEEALRALLPSHVILRTSWLFAANGRNFVRTILRLAQEREEIRVVSDQRGCPTAAADVAAAILTLAGRLRDGDKIPWGTYHYCGTPPTSWYGFARAIVETARQKEIAGPCRVVAVPTSEFPTPAERPRNSVLCCDRIREVLGIEQPPWRSRLEAVLEQWKHE